jgi:protein TonB
MKKFLLAGILVVCKFAGFTQTDATKKQATASDTIRTAERIEIESTFPGGTQGWIRFLNDNLVYPSKAAKKNIQGTVVLQFIVDKDGTVSDIQAIKGPEELRQSAIDAMKKTPKWNPAVQDGKRVKSYKKQPIVYRLE